MRTTSSITVGRDAEISLLGNALAASRQRSGRAVFLLGDAGMGKSRLAGECAYQAYGLGLPVLRGRGSSTLTVTPFRPLIEALASRFRAAGTPTDAELAPYRPALARLVPEWRATAGTAPAYPETVVELAEALLRLLAVLGRDAGCVLLLEDLHDTDAETVAVLEYLVDNLDGLPVLLVGTLRGEPGPALDLVRAAERRRAATVTELRPLPPADVRTMAADILESEAAEVPAPVLERLAERGDGCPYLVEELLADMLASGALRRSEGRWEVAGDLCTAVPTTVVRSWGGRIDQLDPPVRDLLLTAATLGSRFSVATVQLITGHDDRTLFSHLRSACEANVIVPDGADPDRYAFRHALTADAVIATLAPAERAALARRAAGAVLRADPELGDERRQLVAALLVAGGDPAGAAAHLAEAGRRTLAAGAAGSAVVLLERAHELAGSADRAAVVEQLLLALAEAGQLDRAFELARALPAIPSAAPANALPPAPAGHPPAERSSAERAPAHARPATDRRIDLHTRLAFAAVMAERAGEAAAQLAAARALAGTDLRPEQDAALVVVEGHLALLPGHGPAADGAERPERPERPAAAGRTDGTDAAGEPGGTGDTRNTAATDPRPARTRLAETERLARRAAEVAEAAGLPVVACQAWQLLALLARERGFDDAEACLERMLAVAEAHALPVWRVEALLRLGANAFMRTGDGARLEAAREAAAALGAIVLTQTLDGLLAMNAVLRGEWDTARAVIDARLDATARLRNLGAHRYLLLGSATLAAHLGRDREMERELARFRQAGGEESFLMPLRHGLCRAVGALLAEDVDRARAELAAGIAWEEQHPSVFYLAGRHGLHPLLEVLSGTWHRADLARATTAPAAELAWNRQFLGFADAILLGREGHPEEAARAVAAARATAAPFPLAHHLALRLAAESALADGWGEPVAWLRTAEEYFHATGIQPVAAACRALLRRAGASVAQHRGGRDAVPAELRGCGVTLREYEVFVLLAERPGNQQLARRLSISPRTVEKHIAGLLAKTGRPDRAALCDLAAELAAGPLA
ncbi:LuxR family transcriptional regulator [Kitasatospora sp. A2-31]|uniref:helix-turn-helix transcriptional regulator n=1 Tax=Kitasatospora sp. A2-31 TaxID=2916414 RepID=UPI001EEA9D61|nr:LuxR family transcriptional regulator [Kitasatospora sp. A2-31]MCG6498508.1 AAA family ATPase [Kitasatospora sp. A2-31]